MNIKQKTTIGIIYDFDKTLSINDMQTFGLLKDLGFDDPDKFWKMTNSFASKYNMDPTLSFMYVFLDVARKQGKKITEEYLESMGKNIKFFPGLENGEFFDKITEFASSHNVNLLHYVISSGNREIIKGTNIFNKFSKVFACEYLFDSAGEAIFPKVAINFTNKTQFLFRISKGTFNIADSSEVNKEMKDEDRAIPLTNIIYIADGTTDIPCMKVVDEKGGTSIAVYPDNTDNDQAVKIFSEGRASFIEKADYRETSNLYKLLCAIIEKVRLEDLLHKEHVKQVKSYS